MTLETHDASKGTLDPEGEAFDLRTRAQKRGLLPTTEVRILIVDDDEQVCEVMKAALADSDYTVDSVSDTALMEAQLRASKYHVVILDYVLPGLSAEQAFGWVAEHQKDASIIVVTGYPSVNSALSCLRAIAYEYITKPFEIGHLQEVVSRCLEDKGLLRLSEEALCESLGAVIRERRRRLNLTLAELATKSKVSLGYLSQIELGKNSASINTLYKIALALGIRIADLFESM
jgi:DNA-binding response OmpR family regulator